MFDGNEAELGYFLTNVCSLEWNTLLDAGYPVAKAIEERVAMFPDYEPFIRAYQTRWGEMIKGEIVGMIEILAALREQGNMLIALSNMSAESYPYIYKRFEFLHWFAETILSGREKLLKPDPAIFKLLLDRVHLAAEECVFVDDSGINVHAASVLGFQGIHFSSAEEFRAELLERGLI
jgi:2-haloacid dehalogenase